MELNLPMKTKVKQARLQPKPAINTTTVRAVIVPSKSGRGSGKLVLYSIAVK